MPPPQRYEKVAAWNWPYIGPAFQGIDLDLSDLEMSVAALQAGGGGGSRATSAAEAGVTVASPRADVYPYLPTPATVSSVTTTFTQYTKTSQQWAKSLVALGQNTRIGFVAQVPASATEPLKVAEGTSLTDSYNPSAPRTDVPAGSEVVLSSGTTFLTAHSTTASLFIRCKQITGV